MFSRNKQWDPPKRLVIEAHKGKRPQPYHTIRVVYSVPFEAKKKGGAK
jgi:hypothetical protein